MEKVAGGYLQGQVVPHGKGDPAGLKAKVAFGGPWLSPIRPFEMVILDPHGD